MQCILRIAYPVRIPRFSHLTGLKPGKPGRRCIEFSILIINVHTPIIPCTGFQRFAGIDSPVAGYEMAKRGLKMDCLYFHAYPYTSDEALEKVKTLAKEIAPYLNGTRLFVVPFTEGQLNIKEKAAEDATTLMFRAGMMKTAGQVVSNEQMTCIVTGEALSQVASQTLAAMSSTDSMSDYLVLRPLVAFDKQEIINIAKRIGTYDTSILPYEDCCVIFSPKHPITNPDKDEMKKQYESLGMESFITEALENTKIYSYNARGEETGVWNYGDRADENV